MSTVLVFDAGKTGCRVGLWVDGSCVARGEGPGPSGLADPAGVEQALARMAEAEATLETPPGATRPVETIVAGLAGMLSAVEHAPRLRTSLAQRYPGARVVLTSDAITSHAGALAGRAGVVLAAGTGVSVLALSAEGRFHLVDGWGYLLGDAGSGYAIGRAGLDQALRRHDGRGGSEALLARAEARWGQARRIPGLVQGSANPARLVASFARDVFDAAREGDPAARDICEEAAEQLAGSVAAAALGARLGPPVVLATTGGLLHAGAVLTDPLDHHLESLLPGSTRQPAEGDALAGGHLMALRPDLPHHQLLPDRHPQGDVR
ncbi:hypothetical protein NOK12_08030 [Nocardioides sp. OK12]|uniref:N-acetylglucosamine kinase n=1 Tax=Nocardioides sp. OK12 TaxID=2758661 RepID=UPI0021C47F68|nr:BadF/BadG/BcrA/BcrD ATPase family protein [Nocardioides sp. OK12]GHJ58284.1 hypothetical protein NOK12_08030 [Nocardioides sp. OK12]